MDEAIKARNADVALARDEFMRVHGVPRPGDDWADHCAALEDWKRRTGFDAFMKRVYAETFERHGFVRVPEGGWRFNG